MEKAQVVEFEKCDGLYLSRILKRWKWWKGMIVKEKVVKIGHIVNIAIVLVRTCPKRTLFLTEMASTPLSNTVYDRVAGVSLYFLLHAGSLHLEIPLKWSNQSNDRGRGLSFVNFSQIFVKIYATPASERENIPNAPLPTRTDRIRRREKGVNFVEDHE